MVKFFKKIFVMKKVIIFLILCEFFSICLGNGGNKFTIHATSVNGNGSDAWKITIDDDCIVPTEEVLGMNLFNAEFDFYFSGLQLNHNYRIVFSLLFNGNGIVLNNPDSLSTYKVREISVSGSLSNVKFSPEFFISQNANQFSFGITVYRSDPLYVWITEFSTGTSLYNCIEPMRKKTIGFNLISERKEFVHEEEPFINILLLSRNTDTQFNFRLNNFGESIGKCIWEIYDLNGTLVGSGRFQYDNNRDLKIRVEAELLKVYYFVVISLVDDSIIFRKKILFRS